MNDAIHKPLSDAPGDLGQARLTYAWEWFKYHAGQRVSMFNYFLIITGIFANAYVAMLKDGSKQMLTLGGMALGVVGALTAIGFVVLDYRNGSLVERGESVLKSLEVDAIFRDPSHPLPRLIEATEAKPPVMLRHTGWIRTIESVIAVGFLALAIFASPIAEVAKAGSTAEVAKPRSTVQPAKAGPGAKPAKPAAKPGS
jgi:hypothetical protein